MIYSRSLLAFLNKRYFSVLKKCALINAGLLFLAAPASAVDVSTWGGLKTAFDNKDVVTLNSNINAEQKLGAFNRGNFEIQGQGYSIVGGDYSFLDVSTVNASLKLNNVVLNGFKGNFGALFIQQGAKATISGEFKNNESTGDQTGGFATLWGSSDSLTELNVDADVVTKFSGNTTNGVSNAIYNKGGTINLKSTSADIVFDDKITGSNGTINVSGSNNVYFNETVTGNKINLSSGNLILAGKGNFDDSQDFIASGGTLKIDKEGKINLKTATFNNGSTLDIGTKKVTMKEVDFKSGSTLALAIDSIDSYGRLTATTWMIAEGAKLLATLAQGVVNDESGQKFTLLSGLTDATSDKFAQELSDNNNMYNFEKTDVAGEYKITKKSSGGDVSDDTGGSTTNSSAAEAWVDSGKPFPAGSASADLAEKLHQLAQTSQNGEFNDALTALAPEVSPVVRAVSMEIVNQVFSAVSARMTSGGIYEPAEGLSAGDGLFDQVATWVQVLTNKSKLDDTAKAYGFDVDTNGVAMGIEKQFDARYKAGVGYAYSNSDIDAFMRDTNVEAHTFFAYGEYKPSRWFVNGIAAYTFADYDENKNVAGGNYRAKYDIESLSLQVMAGYDALIKGVNVTPEAGFRYYRFDRNSYTDAAGQSVSSKKMDVLTAVLGTKVSKDFVTCGGTHWKPEARLALTYDIVSDKDNALVGLQNGASYFVEGERLKRFGVETGAGIVIDVNDKLETRVGYEGKFRDNYTDHSGVLNLKYKF